MKKLKIINICLIILVLFLGVAYAAELIKAKEVSFSNGKSGLKASNVQSAIEELYNKNISETSCKNVSTPKLGEGLVPVIIDGDGTVTYADTSENWYNYCDKRWANAVILEDGASYKTGDIIQESDIQSYFVWIPKYKYKLWNVDSPSKGVHEIEIVFDEIDTTDVEGVSCKTPMISGESGNCNNGEYMTHPAFISMGVNGFWVGKYETGYRSATSVATAQVNTNDISKIIIKSDQYMWKNINVYNAFLNSYNYQRNLDSHMMKNTEWGAVAYLSHSKYGVNREINLNNNTDFKTGYSATSNTTQQTYNSTRGNTSEYTLKYNTETGYLASTTGNISGIYDMRGGGSEYVAGLIENSFGTSGFTQTEYDKYNSKYFDIYRNNSNSLSFDNRILGDATGEMSPFQNYYDSTNSDFYYHSTWYSDLAIFAYSSNPWFVRGGQSGYGNISGVFYFESYTGIAYAGMSYRIILTP